VGPPPLDDEPLLALPLLPPRLVPLLAPLEAPLLDAPVPLLDAPPLLLPKPELIGLLPQAPATTAASAIVARPPRPSFHSALIDDLFGV
jgi:hypothetical protein